MAKRQRRILAFLRTANQDLPYCISKLQSDWQSVRMPARIIIELGQRKDVAHHSLDVCLASIYCDRNRDRNLRPVIGLQAWYKSIGREKTGLLGSNKSKPSQY